MKNLFDISGNRNFLDHLVSEAQKISRFVQRKKYRWGDA